MTDEQSNDPRIQQSAKPKHRLTPFGFVVLAAVVLLCSGGIAVKANNSDGGATTGSASKYEQTWPKSYKDTSCSEWTFSMTEQQRLAAAADILLAVRRTDDSSVGLPSDAMITDFGSGISNVCEVEIVQSWSLAEMAATVYLTERQRFGP